MKYYWVSGVTPLHKSSLNGQTEVIERLLNQGFDINAQREKGVIQAVSEDKEA